VKNVKEQGKKKKKHVDGKLICPASLKLNIC